MAKFIFPGIISKVNGKRALQKKTLKAAENNNKKTKISREHSPAFSFHRGNPDG